MINMKYELKEKDGTVKRYEVSYSQVLQKQTNNLLAGLIILIIVLLLVIGFTLLEIQLLNIPSRLLGGA